MVKVLTVGIQKGGCSKTTTTAILAHLLAEKGNKVLCIDTDSQGNLTDVLTQVDPLEFEGKTLLNAIAEDDVKPYIMQTLYENVDVVPADDFLATVTQVVYSPHYRKNRIYMLRDLIEQVKDDYDYVLIDTPPSLNELTTAAVVAADHVLILSETSKWSSTAIKRFLATIEHAKENFCDVNVAGILLNMMDSRRFDNQHYLEEIQSKYGELVLKTIIKRKATTGRISTFGLVGNPEIKDAISNYYKVLDELIERGVINE